MAADPSAHSNAITMLSQCTLETCSLALSHFLYIPTLGGNLFFLIFFGVFIIPHLVLGLRYRTWSFAIGMFAGLVLEVIGYVGRVLLNKNPFNDNAFLVYLICLTIAPVFISAAIYLCLIRIIITYGQHLSRFAPRAISIGFMTSDFLSLVLQAIGGAIADTADTNAKSRVGVDIMIAGLLLQAISLAVFLLVIADFGRSCKKGALDDDPEKARVRGRGYFKVFLAGIVLATVVVLVRSIFRVAELWEGFGGKLWNNETDFLVLDGTMIALAVIILTAVHPGLAFGGKWPTVDWSMRKNKASKSVELLAVQGQ